MIEKHPQQYAIFKEDRTFYLGVEVRLVKTERHGFLVQDLVDTDIHHTIFFDQIPALLKASKLRVDRGYYARPQVTLRAQSKIELPFDLESSKRADIGFIFGLVMAWRAYRKTLPAQTTGKAEIAYDAVYPPYVLKHLNQDGPSRLARGKRVPLSTFLAWNRRLQAFNDDARCLIDGRKGNSSARLDPIVEALLQAEFQDYLTLSGPIPASLLDSLGTKIGDINELRRAEGRHDLLTVPSHRTIGRRIDLMDKWLVQAARIGPDEADKAYRVTMSGLPSLRPGERVEVDGWVSDLHTLLGQTAPWAKLPAEIRALLKVVRVTIIVAIDTVTRCIVGISFSWSENSDAIATCLRMAMEDKTEMARSFGCKSNWLMYAWDRWIHDMHPAYDAADVKGAVLKGLGTDQHTPAGIPWLRGRIERFFRTMASKLISFFLGHTGSRPKERTAHQQQEYASVTYDELVGLVIEWVVDVYHIETHRELGMSPLQAWHHFSMHSPPAVALNPIQLVELFGRVVELPADGAGIVYAGSAYNSVKLQLLLRKIGFGKVTVKVDDLDLGQILVQVPKRFVEDKSAIDKAWINVAAPPQLAGISYRRLEMADEEMAIRFGYDAPTTEKIRREAIKAIQGTARAAARARLTEPPVDMDKLRQRMTRTFHPSLQFGDEEYRGKLEALHNTLTLPGARHAASTEPLPSSAPSAIPFTFKD